MLLPQTYFPSHEENRMKNEGDVAAARASFEADRLNNLDVLLESRFKWMNEHIKPDDKIIELGSGAGFLRYYINQGNLFLSDVEKRPWIDLKLDAMNLELEEESVDVFVCSHMIHHLANPKQFFRHISKFLKPNGKILIQELHTSFLLRLLLRAMRHEGWSYEVDVFDETSICNHPDDPWSANCAIPELLFENSEAFEQSVDNFKVLKNSYNECLLFPLSGGVISKTFTIPLPRSILGLIKSADDLLCKISPKTFALGMSIVLEKR